MSRVEDIQKNQREDRISGLLRGASILGLVAVGYYAAAHLGYAFSFRPAGVAVVWVPAGFLLATLVLLKRSAWPFALAGGFLGNALADVAHGISFPNALAGATANGLESLVAAWLVVRFLGTPLTLTSLKEVLGLILGAAVLSNAVTALVGSQVLMRSAQTGVAEGWFVWWIGDGMGMLMIAPVVLTLVAQARSWRKPSPGRLIEGGLLFGALILVANEVLGSGSQTVGFLRTNPYMTFPFLFWAALRFGPAGAASATLVLSAVTAWHAAQGVGPFAAAGSSHLEQVLEAYTFLSLAALSSLVPAATLSEQKKAEERLIQSEREYRQLFESNPHPMWVFDPGTLAFLAVNDAAVHEYGFSREEFRAMTIKDIRPPEDVPRLLADVREAHRGHDVAGIWKHRKKDGTVFDVEIVSHELLWQGRLAKLVLAMDITERQQLEEQLRRSHRMEAVGHLAGGIAHDFNNLLGVIIGYSEIIMEGLRSGDPIYGKVREIKKAGDSAAALTRQLLAFSRKQVIEPRVLDLSAVIADLVRILQRTIGEDIRLEVVTGKELGRVKADPAQIEQVLMNLAVNARDAMPSGGKLTIETADVALDKAYAREHFSAVPGRYVMLAVSDTGIGMDAETQRRIFEPFFTTKEKAKGTGLGLSTVYGIVKQSGGYIWVYSEPGRGTTFKIYLPRVEAPEDVLPRSESARPLQGTETILVVEDAEGVRKLACESLVSKGYRVLAAKDGAEALELARHTAEPIHLLLTDVVLPELGGRVLANQVHALHPETRVLYMSGYTDNAIAHHGVLDPGIAFLQKPFALHDLWRKVREVLDQSSPN